MINGSENNDSITIESVSLKTNSEQILVDADDGNDALDVTVANNNAGNINLDAGDGDDTLNITLGTDNTGNISLNGGLGVDVYMINLDNSNFATAGTKSGITITDTSDDENVIELFGGYTSDNLKSSSDTSSGAAKDILIGISFSLSNDEKILSVKYATASDDGVQSNTSGGTILTLYVTNEETQLKIGKTSSDDLLIDTGLTIGSIVSALKEHKNTDCYIGGSIDGTKFDAIQDYAVAVTEAKFTAAP